MYRKIWKNTAKSIARLSFFTSSNVKIDTLTAFRINEYLITDSYLNAVSNYDTVKISFVDNDGITPTVCKTLSKKVFKDLIIKGTDSFNNDFSVIKANFAEFDCIPSLEFTDESGIEIGQPIVSIGYQLNQKNLSIKRGIVSSIHEANGKKYIEFDATVKNGNAGSPLIDAETGKVIGVIGLKLAQVSHSHKNIKDIINNNIATLKNYQGRLNIDDVDPIQVLIANQNLIKYVANELYQISNMSEGFAAPASEIIHFFKKNIILEPFNPSIDALVNI